MEPTTFMLGRPWHPTGTLKERGRWLPAGIRLGCEHHLALRWKARVGPPPGLSNQAGIGRKDGLREEPPGFAAVPHDGSLADR